MEIKVTINLCLNTTRHNPYKFHNKDLESKHSLYKQLIKQKPINLKHIDDKFRFFNEKNIFERVTESTKSIEIHLRVY